MFINDKYSELKILQSSNINLLARCSRQHYLAHARRADFSIAPRAGFYSESCAPLQRYYLTDLRDYVRIVQVWERVMYLKGKQIGDA